MRSYAPYSSLKAFYHTDRIQGIIDGKRVAPVYLRIKPTNICNQKCFYCAYADNSVYQHRKTDSRESIPWDVMKNLLEDIAQMDIKAVTFSGGGEPLCYKYILETMDNIQTIGVDYSLITNGQDLKGDCAKVFFDAKWIRISFDAAKSGTYESVRGVHTYNTVLANMEDFALKKNAKNVMGVNCVVTQLNSEEIFDICKAVKEVGANNIKLSPIIDDGDYSSYHKDIRKIVCEQISHAKDVLEDDKFSIVDSYSESTVSTDKMNRKYNRCYIQELFAVVAADSKVYRCHQRAYMPEGEVGDLKRTRLRDLWYLKDTIEDVIQFDPRECCQGFWCAFDERNKLLDDFLNIDRNHVNFI